MLIGLESMPTDKEDGEDEASERVALDEAAVSTRELHAPVVSVDDDGVSVLFESLSLVRVLLKRLVIADEREPLFE